MQHPGPARADRILIGNHRLRKYRIPILISSEFYKKFRAMKTKVYLTILLFSVSLACCAYTLQPPQRLENDNTTNFWTGAMNSYWGNAANWSLGHIPDISDDVVIGGNLPACVVDFTPKFCKHLTINAEGSLIIRGTSLTAYQDVMIAGNLSMENATSRLNVYESISWESGSTANITANAQMYIYRFWTFQQGSDVQLTQGTVFFTGVWQSKITNSSVSSFFNNISLIKSSPTSTTFAAPSVQDLVIKGNLFIDSSNTLWHNQVDRNMIIGGNFICDGAYEISRGVCRLNGADQTIRPGNYHYIKHFEVNVTGTVTLDGTHTDTLELGTLTIVNGVFNPSGKTLWIDGDWNNQAGAAGFTETNSTVVFRSESKQLILTDETFDHVIMDKVSDTVVAGGNVTINMQDLSFTGGTWKQSSGSLTVNDLVENGIYGDYVLSGTGEINLHNENGYVDLNGKLTISGGNFNIYGGSGVDSWWPWDHEASCTMTGGTLDFKETGIVIGNNPALPLACNITGGTLRSVHGFVTLGAAFDPAGGTVELYGTGGGPFSTQGGGYVHNLTINTAPAKTILMNGAGRIKGDLYILSGTLDANNKYLTIEGDWNSQPGSGNFIPRTGTVEFAGPLEANIPDPTTFYNLTVNKTFEGTNALVLWGNISVNGNLSIQDGCLEMNLPSNLDVAGNLVIQPSGGLNANDSYGPEISVGGNWVNQTSGYTVLSGFHPGSKSKVTFTGSGDQMLTSMAPREVFNELVMDKPAGKLITPDSLTILSHLVMKRGIWEESGPSIMHKIGGNLLLSPAADVRFATSYTRIAMIGNQPSLISDSSLTSDFWNLIINKSDGLQVTLGTDIKCLANGSLHVENGIFNLNGHVCSVDGLVSVRDNGILRLPGASTLEMLFDGCLILVHQGGRLELLGSPDARPEIRSNSPGFFFPLSISEGATIAAEYANFKNMANHGVYVQAGAIVDTLHAFQYCVFSDGKPGEELLQIDNSQVLTIQGAVFPENTWNGSRNVMKGSDEGMIFMVDYSGEFSGPDYEWDFYDRLHWVEPLVAAITADPGYFCTGGSSQLNVNHDGGYGPFSYLWSPSDYLSDSTVSNPLASPLVSTWYYVTVTDALGDNATDSIWLERLVSLGAVVNISASANPSEPGESVTFSATSSNGGLNAEYQWYINGQVQTIGPASITYIPQNNDEIFCTLTSSYPCMHQNPVSSNIIRMAVVDENAQVSGIYGAGVLLCRDASSVVAVAGGDLEFTVLPDATATLIAGQKILLLPGTKVVAGGYLHAYITQTNEYCNAQPAPDLLSTSTEEVSPVQSGGSLFQLWPNPASDWFKIRLKTPVENDDEYDTEIYSISGNLILRKRFSGNQGLEVQTTGLKQGIYIVRITGTMHAETLRVIITP